MLMKAATVLQTASLAGLVLSFIACFILLVIAPLHETGRTVSSLLVHGHEDVASRPTHCASYGGIARWSSAWIAG